MRRRLTAEQAGLFTAPQAAPTQSQPVPPHGPVERVGAASAVAISQVAVFPGRCSTRVYVCECCGIRWLAAGLTERADGTYWCRQGRGRAYIQG